MELILFSPIVSLFMILNILIALFLIPISIFFLMVAVLVMTRESLCEDCRIPVKVRNSILVEVSEFSHSNDKYVCWKCAERRNAAVLSKGIRV